MDSQPLAIDGSWLFRPTLHHDSRGYFLEAFTATSLLETTQRNLSLAQLNCSVSRKGTVRGIHAAIRPPGQAKYVMCVSGEILDVIVDLRPESPAFGQWDSAVLSQEIDQLCSSQKASVMGSVFSATPQLCFTRHQRPTTRPRNMR